MSTRSATARELDDSHTRAADERNALESLMPDHLETWDAVIGARCNLLLEGQPSATRPILALLTRCLPPVASNLPGRCSRDLPMLDAGALVLHDIEMLTADQQLRLLRWMDLPRCPQVVATSSRAVFPLVLKGLFAEALYYRLNTILVRVNSAALRKASARRQNAVHPVVTIV
jgi:hypothetical protein